MISAADLIRPALHRARARHPTWAKPCATVLPRPARRSSRPSRCDTAIRPACSRPPASALPLSIRFRRARAVATTLIVRPFTPTTRGRGLHAVVGGGAAVASGQGLSRRDPQGERAAGTYSATPATWGRKRLSFATFDLRGTWHASPSSRPDRFHQTTREQHGSFPDMFERMVRAEDPTSHCRRCQHPERRCASRSEQARRPS